ncbi:hypothetical protein LJC33_00190 [Eubacteriales bacterium OttesenSCG-928-N13]|nr:hypothetical protein [Eubacteriales bacterium OttesenSCG-928-N13]
MPSITRKTPREKDISTVPSFVCAALCSFALFLYIPSISYLSNVNFYSFHLTQLLLGLLIPFLLLTVLLGVVLALLSGFLHAKASRLCFESPKRGALISVFHVVLVLFVFCIWLEGNPLSSDLPALTGASDIFDSVPRMVWDSLVWLLVLALGVIFWRRLAGNYAFLLLGACLLLGLGLADAAINQEVKTRAIDTTASEVLDRVAFSSEDNVLVLVLDATSTAVVQDYLAENPEAEDTFNGFTLFQNNMETASSTQWALPSMIKGDIYTGGSVIGYQSAVFDVPEAATQIFSERGYDVYASSTLPLYNCYMLSEASERSATRSSITVDEGLYHQFWVRFAPYALKNEVSSRATISGVVETTEHLTGGNLQALQGVPQANEDETAYLVLMEAARAQSSSQPTFHFHHVNGAHMPYTIDSEGNPLPTEEQGTLHGLHEQSTWTLDYVQALMQTLKDSGLYDTTTIVLLGDHGDRLWDASRENQGYARHASLLVKPAGSTGDFTVSDAPTSNLYLRDFLTGLHLEGESLDSLTENLPGQRSRLMDGKVMEVYEGADVTKLMLVEEVQVVQEYDATLLRMDTQYQLSTLMENANVAYPLSFENANLTNGWGLRTLGEEMSVSFQVDAEPGQVLDLALRISTSALTGGYPEFEPYELTVRDELSGHSASFTIEESRPEISLAGVTVSESASIQLHFSLAQPPDLTTMQVVLIEILPRLSGKSGATPLSVDTRYSLATNKKKDGATTVATPLDYSGADISNGWGLKALGEEMRLAFSVEEAPGQKLNTTLVLSTSALTGEYPAFDPYTLTVRDEVSGHAVGFTVDESRKTVKLDNVTVDQDASIRLALSFSGYPDPAIMKLTVVEIETESYLDQNAGATILKLGTQYSLSTFEEEKVTAYPFTYENADFSNGWGLKALGEEMVCAFLMDDPVGLKTDVTMLLSTSDLAGGYPEFEPYTLTVRDKTTGREQAFTIEESLQEITVQDVRLSGAFTIQLAFAISQYPDPETMQVMLVELTVQEAAYRASASHNLTNVNGSLP